MKEILEEVKRLTLELLGRGASSAEIDSAVELLLQQRGFETALARETQRLMEQEWASRYTLNAQERQVAVQILARSERGFARVGEKVIERVSDTVLDGIRRDLSSRQIEGRLTAELDVSKLHAQTITNTARAAFSRGRAVGSAERAGLVFFRYDGAGAQRVFCKNHLGNTYHVDEIRSMDNGQGLPVLYYGGGWRCVHKWTAVEPPKSAEATQ